MAQKKRPDQVRRRNTKLITTLPAGGRGGQAPAWPLGKATADERRHWNDLWKKPQAVIWEQWHAEDVVAQYVQIVVRCEQPDPPVMLLSERRQMQMQLGLLPGALFRLQWTLTDDTPSLQDVTDLDAYREAVG